jgi:hypothetical protein
MFTYQEFPAIKKVYRQQINYRQNPLLFNTIRYVVLCKYTAIILIIEQVISSPNIGVCHFG